ncbi:MAG: MBL fold metallo-hydrolase [Acidobacteria bacterium]|nr:MBL fold metallo-hydrolase [Acidobacteriota bacterium]
MTKILMNTRVIDVGYLGMSQYIACCLLEGEGPAIVDPGPTVSLGKLEEGLQKVGLTLDDLGSILLTHIHLDHAGATGTIVKRNPRIKVYVHEKGVPHMIDPERLLVSVGRLYGEHRMDELFGDFLPVPKENIQSLSGGESLGIADRQLQVAYTPGHAAHHVSFLDTSTGTAFVGDTAGIRIANDPLVLPVTPPPDIDLEIWESSLQKIEGWKPERLFVTHFGQAEGVEEHLTRFRENLHQWATAVRRGVESNATDEECLEEFTAAVDSRLKERLSANKVALYQQGGAPWMSWPGLARYWRKKLKAS